MNIPNMLTVGRIAVIPVLVALVYLPNTWIKATHAQYLATALFVLAAVTDWLDGYLARRLGQHSSLGAWLDPVADKLLVCATLTLLVHMARLHAIVAIVIIGREIAISALREWMAQVGQTKTVAVALVGKLKTTAQMVAIPFLLAELPVGSELTTVHLGTGLIWLAVVLTVWSMAHYVRLSLDVMLRADRKAALRI